MQPDGPFQSHGHCLSVSQYSCSLIGWTPPGRARSPWLLASPSSARRSLTVPFPTHQDAAPASLQLRGYMPVSCSSCNSESTPPFSRPSVLQFLLSSLLPKPPLAPHCYFRRRQQLLGRGSSPTEVPQALSPLPWCWQRDNQEPWLSPAHHRLMPIRPDHYLLLPLSQCRFLS